MIIIGLAANLDSFQNNEERFFQDNAAVLIVDGDVVSTIETKKLQKIKKNKNPFSTVLFVLRDYGIKFKDIDKIALFGTEEYLNHMFKNHYLNRHPEGCGDIKGYLHIEFQKEFNVDMSRCDLFFVNPHFAYAVNMFTLSGYDRSLFLTVNKVDDRCSFLVLKGEKNRVDELDSFTGPVFEKSLDEKVLESLSHHGRNSGSTALCITGNTSASSSLEENIRSAGVFHDIFSQPIEHAAGFARGAGLYLYHKEAPTRPQPEVKYEAHRNETEKILTQIWQEILSKEKISINDNFFDLGGNSLTAIVLENEIQKALNVKLSLPEVFKFPTIKELSNRVTGLPEDRYAAIAPVEKKEYYISSSSQMRLYFLQQMDEQGIGYNIPAAAILEGDVDENRLENTFRHLLHRHESLRTSFHMTADKPVQRVHDQVEFEIEYYDISEVEVKVKVEEAGGTRGPAPLSISTPHTPHPVEAVISSFIRHFDLSRAPLFRVGVIKEEEKKYILVVDMHHIISDGVSSGIMINEFISIYGGKNLIHMRLQYKDFSRWQNSKKVRESLKQQEEYWLKEFEGDIPVLNLPMDFTRPVTKSFEGSAVNFEIDKKDTMMLKTYAREEGTTLFIVLLAVFNILLSKLSSQEDIIVGTPVAGRHHSDLEHIVGMFVNTLVLRNFPRGDKSFNQFLDEVKNRTLEAFENQDYQYEELVERATPVRDVGRNPLFDIMLVLQNMDLPRLEMPGLNLKPYQFHKRTSVFDLNFLCIEIEEMLLCTFEYSTKIFKPVTINRFIYYLKKIIPIVIESPGVKIPDIEIISEEEKKQVLCDFNNTNADYPKEKTIRQMFEEQVERTPDNTALYGSTAAWIHGRGHITYSELNTKSNQLARLLIEKGVKADTIVALMLYRSIEMIAGILGILKAGGAYLPIDTDYPEKRILSILEESGALYLLTDENVSKSISFTSQQRINTNPDRIRPVVTAARQPIKDFDSLPFPNRALVNYEAYHQHIGIAMARHTVSLQATRGCPYNCAYCHKIWSKKHVVRSAENIFEEMKRLHHAGVKRFVFIDDIFNLEIKNSSKLLEMLIKKMPGIQLFFPNGLRGDILTKEYIDLMIEAGTVNIDLALESASPRIQKMIGKNLNLEKFRKNVRYITRKHPQLLLEMELMIGFPTETEEEALMTLDYLKSLKWVHFPNLNILKIYPNTDMCRLALENGVSMESIESSVNLAYHELPDTLPFSMNFTRLFQARFMNEYMLSKERLLHLLPYQVKTLGREELIQKYDSYFPQEIKDFTGILQLGGISKEEFGKVQWLKDENMAVPRFKQEINKSFSTNSRTQSKNALRILLLDLSQFFTRDSRGMLYDMVEEPLGLMYLLTYLNRQLGKRIKGKIAKSRIDFDSFEELKQLIFDFKPDVIGIRTLSYYKEFFHKTAALVRSWGIEVPIIAGGPYASSDYLQLLQDSHVNLAVLGEGEQTLTQLVEKTITNGNRLPHQDQLQNIPGIAFIKEKNKSILEQRKRDIILTDQVSGTPEKQTKENPLKINKPEHLLYLIPTSGSTGKPKIVMLEHRNLRNLMEYQFSHLDIDFTRVLQFASLGFDASAHEIFSTLLSGGTLFLITREIRYDISRLLNYIRENFVNIVFLPPAFLKYAFGDSEYAAAFPTCIKHIIAAGEQLVVPGPFQKYLQANHVFLHNDYGPAETHVVTTLTLDPTGEIPELPGIGKPIINTNIFILDRAMNLQPIGIVGELYIGGTSVGRGYLNNPELTGQKFQILDRDGYYMPYRSYKSYIIYKTGDLARWRWDENIEYLGRIDHLVKIRGFRIELGEIESQLANHSEIKEAVAVLREDDREDKYICAYIVSDRKPSISGLREYLSKILPNYMIPSFFVYIDKIPLTPSGKVDRKALPEPDIKTGEEYIAPRDEIETKLVRIWSDILGIEKTKISIKANFFGSGGHSLRAIIMVSKIQKEFNIKMTIAEVFARPRLEDLAAYITLAERRIFKAVMPVETREYYPQSSAQKRLFLLDQFENIGTSYHIPIFFKIKGNIHKEKYKSAIKELIRRHETLRTSFELKDNEPIQRVHREIDFKIEEVTCQGKDIKEIIKDFVRPFDLARVPLLRIGMALLSKDEYLFLFDMHHIIGDGTSMGIMIAEFGGLWEGKESLPLRIQYRDFSGWQNHLFETGKIKLQKEYWCQLYADAPDVPKLNLPTDYPRPVLFSYIGDSYYFKFNIQDSIRFKEIGTRAGATPFMTLLALFNLLLFKYTGQEDIIVGCEIAGRPHVDLQHIIGMFVNELAMRNSPIGKKSFIQFLEEVKENSLNGFKNQDYQFEELVDRLNLDRDTSRNPLFDVEFAFQNFESPTLGLKDVSFTPVVFENKTADFDIALDAMEVEDQIYLRFQYCTSLFKKKTIQSMAAHLLNALGAVSRHPGSLLADISILSEKEKQQVLFEFNNTGKDFEKDKSYPQLFEIQAVKTPDRIAAIYKDEFLSYSQLDETSGHLAQYLYYEKNIRPDDLVGIILDRSNYFLTAVIGIMKADAAYIPIEPFMPEERIKKITTDAEIGVLVSQEKYMETLHQLREESKGLHTLLCLDNDNDEPPAGPGVSRGQFFQKAPPLIGRPRRQPAEGTAYVIYTSGTTGEPKGAMIHQQGLINHLYALINDLSITGEDIIAQTAPAGFDISVWQFLAALLKGGVTLIIDKEIVLEPGQFLHVLQKGRVTVLESVPSLMTAFLEIFPFEKDKELKYLRWMIPTGEALSAALARRWYHHYPDIKLVNAYGPAEASDDVTLYVVDRVPETQLTVPIGKPLRNFQVYILDKYLSLCPPGVRGEICVAGIGVGKGYLNNPELTFEKFIRPRIFTADNRSYRSYKSYILYKTGDIGYFREDGLIECLGRMDQQVKIRGNRIELEEIESQLLNRDDINEAVVIARDDKKGNKNLYSYFISNKTLDINELREYLNGVLPNYMIPAYFMQIDKIPVTPNGKVDRKRLPDPGPVETGDKYIPPGNKIEEKLVEIWSEVLGIGKSKISVDADFFRMGGHSLRATIMATRVQKELNVQLPLAEIFKTPTVRELSGYIKGLTRGKYISIQPLEQKEYYHLSSTQRRLFFLQRVDPGNKSYNIPYTLLLEGEIGKGRVREMYCQMIRRHESFRTSFHMVNEEPMQRIPREVDFEVEYHETEEGSQQYKKILKSIDCLFDLGQAPLFKVWLIKVGQGKYILVNTFHHVITDGVSLGIIISELMAIYKGEQLPPLRIQYKDYADWQNRKPQQEAIKKQEAYWLREFSGEIPLLNLHTDYERPEIFIFEGEVVHFNIDNTWISSLKQLALEEGATLYMVLLAIYTLFLSKISGQEDIIVGTSVTYRQHEDLMNVIGMFVNALAMRNYPTSGKTFLQFLGDVKKRTLEAFDNQDYQFEDLVHEVIDTPDHGRNPIFDVMFVLNNEDIPQIEIPGLKLTPFQYDESSAQMDLKLRGIETDSEILFSFEYATKLFKRETIEMYIKNFKEVISAVLEEPGLQLKDINISHGLLSMESSILEAEQGDFVF